MRKTSVLLISVQLSDELGRAEHIGNAQVPAHRVGVHMVTERFHGGPAPDSNLIPVFDKIPIKIEELDFVFAFGIAPALLGNRKLAVASHGFAVSDDVIPNKTTRRVSQRID